MSTIKTKAMQVYTSWY